MGQELKHMNLWGTFLFKRPDLESLLCMECHTHHGPVSRILSDSSLFLQCPQRARTRVNTYRYVIKSSNLPSSSKCIAPPSPCCLGQTLRSHSRNLYFLYYLEPTQCHHQIACAAHRFQWSPCWGGLCHFHPQLGTWVQKVIVLRQSSVLMSSSPGTDLF